MFEFVMVVCFYVKVVFDFVVEYNSVECWQDMLVFVVEVIKND